MVTRSALPQQYRRSSPDVWQDMQDTENWVVRVGTGTVSADTTNFLSGDRAVKITATNSASPVYVAKTLGWTNMLGKMNEVIVYFYVTSADIANLASVKIRINTSSSNWFTYAEWAQTYRFVAGWNALICSEVSRTVAGTLNFATVYGIQIIVTPNAGASTSVTVGAIHNAYHRPAILLTLDDGRVNQYSKLFPVMQELGLHGTVYVNTDLIDTTSFYVTTANLQEMYADGFAISNHSATHQSLGGLTSEEQYTLLKRGQDWLLDNGFTRSAHHVSYPNGSYNNDTFAAMESLGILTARASGGYAFTELIGNGKYIWSGPLTTSTGGDSTLANAKTVIGKYNRAGLTLGIIMHSVDEEGYWSLDDVTALLEYIVSKKIPCLTIDEWYNGLTNPRYRSLPMRS